MDELSKALDEFKALPEWLQWLWNHDSKFARQAEAEFNTNRDALNKIIELGKDSHDVPDDVRWREMWHVAVAAVESWRLEEPK